MSADVLDPLFIVEDLQGQAQKLESNSPGFLREKLLEAQKKSWVVLRELENRIQAGMTEDEARILALQIFAEKGVTKHWHRPYIRFGAGTALTYHDPVQDGYRLKEGDPVYLDLGPVWPDSENSLSYEGDVGDSFVLGRHPEAEKCAQAARDIFFEIRERWKIENLSGKSIYLEMKKSAELRGYDLVEKADGHRMGDFPHQKYSKERLSHLSFVPGPDLWILEVKLNDKNARFGSFYEDLLSH